MPTVPSDTARVDSIEHNKIITATDSLNLKWQLIEQKINNQKQKPK